MAHRATNVALLASALLAALVLPQTIRAEHCAGAFFVDGLEPSAPKVWQIGEVREVTWQVGSGCGELSYQVEMSRDGEPYAILGVTDPVEFDGTLTFPWTVTGPAGSSVQFRVVRVHPDLELTYSYTALIEIEGAVALEKLSWTALRRNFSPKR